MIADLKPYPAMKESGVPPLGDVPQHWDLRRLGQIGRLSKGNGGNKEHEVETGVPCVRYGDLYTTHTYFILKSRSCIAPERAEDYTAIAFGDVLFAASGETINDIGKSAVNLIQSQACCGGDVILFRPKRQVEARYMGYATDCRPAATQKASMGRGITVKHIYGGELKYLTLALPPLPEQAAIARFLDYADRRIRRSILAKQRLIKLLEEQKQAIIHRAVTRGLDPSVPLKPSGIPWLDDIPQYWEVRRLSSVARFQSGKAHEQFVDPAGENVCVTARFVSTGGKSRKYCTKNFCPAAQGDVLMVMSDLPNGRALARAFYVDDDTRYAVNQRVCIIRSYAMNPKFLAYSANRNVSLLRNDDGANQTHLSNGDFKTMPLVCPPRAEQDLIVRMLDRSTGELRIAAEAADSEIDLLREYRTRLIADVVTGKLDVREAAARLPDEVDEVESPDDTEPIPEDAEVGDDTDLDASSEEAEV